MIFRVFIIFIALLVGNISFQMTLAPAFAMAGVHGVFAYDAVHHLVRSTQLAIDSSMLTDSEVDGVNVHVNWSDVETADGTYSWATLDYYIAQAAAANKKITFFVLPGYETPAWVYTEGAQSFQFKWDRPWGPALCSTQSTPIPWDPIFLKKWTALIRALGARYSGNHTVVGVKMTGINSYDEEANLPYTVHEQIGSGSSSCTGSNYPVLWQQAGYTRTLLVNSWLQIAQAYQAAFPMTELMAVLQPFGFPPIDENGHIFSISQGADPFASEDIAADAVADFPNQIALQNDGLTYNWIAGFLDVYANDVATGYQTLGELGGHLAAAMSLATANGAQYLELYEGDLLNSGLTAQIKASRLILLAN